MSDRVTDIEALARPILAERDMELVELTCRPQGGQQVIRLLVDAVGGVTIAQCAQVNQRLSAALEAANAIEGSYTVEVSSPGLDRPLVTKRDFERAVGEELAVIMRIEEGRTKELDGILLAVQPEAIVVKTPGGNLTIPLAQIQTAKKAIRW
jgi:ribosome maturation factor RimP